MRTGIRMRTFKGFFLLVCASLCFLLPMETINAGYSSGGSRSSSSGSSSRSYSSGSSSRSFSSGSSKSSPSSSSGKSFSSGSSSSSSKSSVSSPTRSFDSKAASASKSESSKSSFFRSRETYTRPPVSEPKVQETKRQTFYSSYYSNPQYAREVHHYHYRDSYNPYFMLWLLDRSSDERAMWAYHHRSDMDKDRYNELLKKDVTLENKVKELEAKGLAKDPNYKPQGVDNDLMYKSDNEVKKDSGFAWGALLSWLGVIALISSIVWFTFFKRMW